MASKHGIRLDVNDPAISIVLVNRLVLEHSTDELVAAIRASMHDFEEAVRKVQTRAGQLVAAEFNDRVGAIRSELQRDIALETAAASQATARLDLTLVELGNKYETHNLVRNLDGLMPLPKRGDSLLQLLVTDDARRQGSCDISYWGTEIRGGSADGQCRRSRFIRDR